MSSFPTDWYDNPTGMDGIPAPLAPVRPNASNPLPPLSSDYGILGVPTGPLVLDGVPLVPQTPAQQLNYNNANTANAPTPGQGFLNNAIDAVTGAMRGMGATVNPGNLANAKAAGYTGFGSDIVGGLANLAFSSRLIMLVVGIILIAAGLFSFKQTQTVVKLATRAAS